MSYFPERHTNKNKMEVELDFSYYAKKSILKSTRCIGILQFAGKDYLANLKPDIVK